MGQDDKPRFFELSSAEAVELLRRNHVGRLAFSFHDHVDVEPLSYVYDGEWLYGRTSQGAKLTTVLHHPWVALEVDEIEGAYDWRSVVAHGTIYFMEPEGGDREREAYARGLELLRALDERILTGADLAPQRTTLFRVHVDDLVGRGASTQE
ncbi:MAG TPA: pyridoxamine 5'-phosphate oxidase family protein [Gemmatimonadaceae bacterium]|nr:pyridoxamine 5'-phosphate oxidase family protein [Gemmatimonadaceae bacterium]